MKWQKRGYQDRKLVLWCLTIFAGAVVTFAAMNDDGLRGVAGVALGTLLLLAGAAGMLWRLGQLQDEMAKVSQEPSQGPTRSA